MRDTAQSMGIKIASAGTASISSPFRCITRSNLIKRVVFKHQLAQLLRRARVAQEEPGLGSLELGKHQPAQGRAGKGRGQPPACPEPALSSRTAPSLALSCLGTAKGKEKRPRVATKWKIPLVFMPGENSKMREISLHNQPLNAHRSFSLENLSEKATCPWISFYLEQPKCRFAHAALSEGARSGPKVLVLVLKIRSGGFSFLVG